MKLRFFKDPETGEPHIGKHAVTEEEVRQVMARPGQDRRASGDSRKRLGQTYLTVIYVPDQVGPGVFIITAYDLRGKALKAYRRYRRKKDR
jgi:hypothetical protein